MLVACTPSTTNNTQFPQQGQQVTAPSLTALSPVPFEKRWIIAVTDFTVPRGHINIEGRIQSPEALHDFGKSLADTFSSQAFQSQQFRVTERSALASILEEINLANSGLVDANTASKIGKVTGAELLAFGTVNNLSVQSKTTEVLGLESTTVAIMASINVRLVHTATAELMASANGTGESNSQSVTVDLTREVQDNAQGSNTGDIYAVLQTAIQQSIQQLIRQLPSK